MKLSYVITLSILSQGLLPSRGYLTNRLFVAGCGEGGVCGELPLWQQDVYADVGLCHGVLVQRQHHSEGAVPGTRGLLWSPGKHAILS